MNTILCYIYPDMADFEVVVALHRLRNAGKRRIITVAETKDGVNWNAAAVLEYRTGAVQYSYPAMIQTRDGLVHITYSWHRKRIKHVVIDPAKLVTAPIVDGVWPKEELPWIMSADSVAVNGGRDTEVLK